MTTAEEFLFGAGTSARFENIGDRVSGIVLTEPVMRAQTDFSTGQPKFWPSGEPMEQMVIRLLTQERSDADDDGVRVLYIDSRNKRETLRDAVRDAGGKKILVGGFVEMIYTGDGPKQGGNPPKLYAAQYTQPTQQTLALVEQYRSGGQQQAQQAPHPSTQPNYGQPQGQPPWPQPNGGQVHPQQSQPQWGPPPQPAQGFPTQHPGQPLGALQQPAYIPPQSAQLPQQPHPAPVPPPQPQPAQPSYTAEIIAAIYAAGQDPKTIYADYDGRYDSIVGR